MSRRKPSSKPQGKTGKAGTPARGKAPRGKPPARQAAIRGHLLSEDADGAAVPAAFSEIADVKKRLFLQAIAQVPRVSRACRAAGVCTRTGYEWRANREDVLFLEAFEKAWKMGIERVEGELFRRGVEGYDVPVYHQGQLVGTEKRFSDTAAIFMLKGAKPETYADRHQHSGPGGAPIQTENKNLNLNATVPTGGLASLTSEELLAQMEVAAAVLRANNEVHLLAPVAGMVAAEARPLTPAEQYAAELAQRTGKA